VEGITSTDVSPLFSGLRRRERFGLVLLALLTVVFGVIVEHRAVGLSECRSDLSIYLGAAWRVRAGTDPYDYENGQGSHYNYPPFLAILLTPLAMKPAGAAGLAVPFALSVALWYLASVAALVFGVDQLASALEATAPDAAVRAQPQRCRRWWLLRLLPIIVCLPGIARTLSLGQVDLFVLALFCLTIAAAQRQQSWRAGLWLAAAICIKLIPAFLLLYPLRRCDVRWLAGCALGLAVGWGVIPTVVWGPQRAWAEQVRWVNLVVLPGLGLGQDHSRDEDLTSFTSVNSQSLVAILHNYQHPIYLQRPAQPAAWAKVTAMAIGGILTALTLLAAGPATGIWRTATVLGALVTVMLLLAPVCHPHYLCHWLPLVMALLAWDLERRQNRSIGPALVLLFAANVLSNVLTSVFVPLREFGLATGAGLALWGTALVALWCWQPDGRTQPVESKPVRLAA
jgi:alpha-1,2-mannosyltransferase